MSENSDSQLNTTLRLRGAVNNTIVLQFAPVVFG